MHTYRLRYLNQDEVPLGGIVIYVKLMTGKIHTLVTEHDAETFLDVKKELQPPR